MKQQSKSSKKHDKEIIKKLYIVNSQSLDVSLQIISNYSKEL